jgi:type II secretory pathway component PulC
MVNLFKKIIPLIVITILAAGGVEVFYRTIFAKYLSVPSALKSQGVEEKGVISGAVPAAGSRKKPADRRAILKRNLFGTPAKAAKPATTESPTPEQLAATALDLGLLGTIAGPPNNRRAIILDKKKKLQDIYYQGDVIQGALIKEIQRGKVILNVNGKDEILVPEIPKAKAGAAAAAGPNFSSPMPAEIPQESPPETAPEPPPEIAQEPVIEQPEPVEPVVNNRAEPNEREATPPTQPPQNLPPLPQMNNHQEKP